MSFLRNTRHLSTPVFFLLLCLGAVCLRIGATKGGGNGGGEILAQFVLWDGVNIIDPSGTIPAYTPLAMACAVITNAADIGGAALDDAGAVVELVDELYPLFEQIGGDVVYVALRWPFSTPDNTMKNTAATLMKWTQYENKVEAFWWFSSVPYNAVTVFLPVVDETGRTHRLEETCNEWPVTTNVDGVPCYRTVYDIPPELEGVLLIPPGDPTFGGGGRQFQIPEGGFMYVDANGIMRQGKTEVTVLDDGAGTVFKIYHQGGVAVKFELNGVELEDGEVIICE